MRYLGMPFPILKAGLRSFLGLHDAAGGPGAPVYPRTACDPNGTVLLDYAPNGSPDSRWPRPCGPCPRP